MALTITLTPSGTLNSTTYGQSTAFTIDCRDFSQGEMDIVDTYEEIVDVTYGNMGTLIHNIGAEKAIIRVSADGTNYARFALAVDKFIWIPEFMTCTGMVATVMLPVTTIYARSATATGTTLFVLNCTR